jgi:biopolymer transport protein ExbD
MARRQQEDPKAEMTPMIDVVFQLMIFFIVTIKQEDIFSKLNASAPSPNPNQAQQDQVKETPIEIQIGSDKRFVIFGSNRELIKFSTLDQYIKEQASLSKETAVHLKCTLDSPHGNLIRVLDICHKYQMNNLSILSM